jgi:hypothetical protein
MSYMPFGSLSQLGQLQTSFDVHVLVRFNDETLRRAILAAVEVKFCAAKLIPLCGAADDRCRTPSDQIFFVILMYGKSNTCRH